jgi:hypothetical protein
MIDQSIPAPHPRQKMAASRGEIVPGIVMAKMKVGDSFFTPRDYPLDISVMRAKVSNQAKKCGIQMTSRMVNGGWRFWRIA